MKKKTTPQLLADALFELAEKKDIDKIKIKEIVEVCGLSSQTFYNHFSDKYDLVHWITKSAHDLMIEKMEKGNLTFREMVADNIRFYSEHSVFMLNALRNTHGQDSFLLQSSESAYEGLYHYILKKNNIKKLSEQEQTHLRMFIYSNTGLYAYWAFNGKKIPAETLADYVVGCIPESLKTYLL